MFLILRINVYRELSRGFRFSLWGEIFNFVSQGGFRRGSWDLFKCEYVFKVIEKLLSESIRSYPVSSPPVSSPLGGGVPTNLSPTYFTDRVEKFISRLCNSIRISIQEASNESWFLFFIGKKNSRATVYIYNPCIEMIQKRWIAIFEADR